jgi:hyperosmotically inducible periplasmic protein
LISYSNHQGDFFMELKSNKSRDTQVLTHILESDEQITAAFKQSYTFKTYLSDEVTVQGKDGVMSLRGEVSEAYYKALAEDTLANLPGVVRVDNQLIHQPLTNRELSDLGIASRVKLALLCDRHTSPQTTQVEVKDGVITLRGEATSQAQKEMTTESALAVKGMSSVINIMSLTTAPAAIPVEPMDDASITAHVKAALTTHQATDGRGISVVTRDGHVTLTGGDRHPDDKSLITNRIAKFRGVVSVNNQMSTWTVPEVPADPTSF